MLNVKIKYAAIILDGKSSICLKNVNILAHPASDYACKESIAGYADPRYSSPALPPSLLTKSSTKDTPAMSSESGSSSSSAA